MKDASYKNILVISNCRLGDSIIMAPAFGLLRENWPDATIGLVSEQGGNGIVAANEILGNRGLVDEFYAMSTQGSKLCRFKSRLNLICQLRKRSWDLGIVLFPPYPPLTMPLINRFKLYLRLAGTRRIIIPREVIPMDKDQAGNLHPQAHVIDATLDVLRPLGITIPKPGEADPTLPPPSITASGIVLPPNKQFIAVAPGTNMQSKCWPKERFAYVLKAIASKNSICPVYFGGETDRPTCDFLNSQVPGIEVIGQSLPEVEATMRNCCIYLGNDTGLMHLAAAVQIPCLAIFSCRHPAGMWEPYGNGHIVMRETQMDCAGCQAETCPLPTHPCIMNISEDAVLSALEMLVKQKINQTTIPGRQQK